MHRAYGPAGLAFALMVSPAAAKAMTAGVMAVRGAGVEAGAAPVYPVVALDLVAHWALLMYDHGCSHHVVPMLLPHAVAAGSCFYAQPGKSADFHMTCSSTLRIAAALVGYRHHRVRLWCGFRVCRPAPMEWN